MTVDNALVIDAIGVDKVGGEVVLTVADHLAWDDTHFHLQVLQSKLNAYLAFIESGELFEEYPDAIGRTVRIEVVLKYPPGDLAQQFFRNAAATIESAGLNLSYRILDG